MEDYRSDSVFDAVISGREAAEAAAGAVYHRTEEATTTTNDDDAEVVSSTADSSSGVGMFQPRSAAQRAVGSTPSSSAGPGSPVSLAVEVASNSTYQEGISCDNTRDNMDNLGDEDSEDSSGGSESEEDTSVSSEEEENLILENRLRKRRTNQVRDEEKAADDEHRRSVARQLSAVADKPREDWTEEEAGLVEAYGSQYDDVLRRRDRKRRDAERKQEIEDPPELLAKKCAVVARAMEKAKSLVVYTGAGISTAANIPDYRGPNGVWTLLDQGKEIVHCNLEQATPTYTHMALFTLYKRGKLKHVVSQNCDGLHMRSGIPRYALSELHGNMFVEICKHCRPARPFVRLFDVTERTNKNRHATMRRCYVCGNSLYDTIVHFGERGALKWPINWSGATKAADKADVILCLGSSLKVLRRYPWLWCMDRPPRQRPKLFIVNLQWTPKDSAAKIKINGRCDEVMAQLMAMLGLKVPEYCQANDPLFTYATSLNPLEAHTSTRNNVIVKPEIKEEVKEEPPSEVRKEESAEVKKEDCTEEGSGSPVVDSSKRDHDYGVRPSRVRRAPDRYNVHGAGVLVHGGDIDFAKIRWPRDALYLPYVNSFEYIEDVRDEDTVVGENAFCCDCCDPARKKKNRKGDGDTSTSTSEDSDDEEEEEEETNSNSNSNSNNLRSNSNTPDVSDADSNSGRSPSVSTSNQPGWFGKGRRKRSRLC